MITDNNFTAAELQAAIEANPELTKQIVLPDYTFRSKDEETTYVANLEQQHIAKHTSATAKLVEKSVFDATGIEKLKDEKYYDYSARALAAVSGERTQLRKDIDDLKSKSDLSAAERQQLAELTKLSKETQDKYDALETSSKTELQKAKLENKIGNKVATVAPKLLKSELPGFVSARNIMHDKITEDIQRMATVDSRGEIILMDGENAITNSSDASFKTVEQYYEEKMKEYGFIDGGKKLPGAGGNGGGDAPKSTVPGGCKTPDELLDWLRANTMKDKSQSELISEFDKYAHLFK